MLVRFITAGVLVATVCLSTLTAEVRAFELNSLFSYAGVLQRDVEVPIFGTGADGQQVTVQFNGHTASTVVRDGQWRVNLPPMKAGGPYSLQVRGPRTINVSDIMVGEVWICGGQSNMQWPVYNTDNAVYTIARASNQNLRLFSVERKAAREPQNKFSGTWAAASPSSITSFSAVGYYFGRKLHEHLDVPVGLISANFAGTPAEAWTSSQALQSDVQLAGLVSDPPAVFSQESPSALYNSMIHPLMPYAIRGVIWYQGESNVQRAYQYRTLFPTLISDWRERWGQGDFPFLFVQLAPYSSIIREPSESAWAELRDAQLLTYKTVPNTAIAVITDAGDQRSENPRDKEPVAERLFQAARAVAYGEEVPYVGPIYKSYKIREDKIRLQFDHVDGGLVSRGETLQGFTICGIDRVYYNAQAIIEGDEVVVWNDNIEHPIAVRYGWADYPLVNLWNEAGFPASPFRTDNFPLVTEPKASAQ